MRPRLDVLVIDDAQLVEAVGDGERHVVDRACRLEVAGDILPDLAVIQRLQRFVAFVALEHEHCRRRRRGQGRLRENDPDGFAKLLQALGDLPQVAGADIADDAEICARETNPALPRHDRRRRGGPRQ